MIASGLNKNGIMCYWLQEQPVTCRKEDCEQIDLNSKCSVLWPDEYQSMWHTVNESGAGGSKQYGAKLQKMGRKSGVCDWVVMMPKGDKHGLLIELKRARKSDSRVSVEQAEFMLRQQELGYEVAICYGYKAAIHCIEKYLQK